MCSSLVNTLLNFAMLHNEKRHSEDRSSNVHMLLQDSSQTKQRLKKCHLEKSVNLFLMSLGSNTMTSFLSELKRKKNDVFKDFMSIRQA